jgi:ribosomal protein L32
MAVPKKKISRGVSKTRKKAWTKINVTRIKKLVQLVKDKETGDIHLNHHVNPTTGKYKGRQILDKSKELDKITTIKA